MIGYAPLLGEVKLVDRPSFLSQKEAAGSVPYGDPGCTDADIFKYQSGMAAAADEIASNQQAMKAAVAAGDQGAIDRANISANRANSDWQAWSHNLKVCQAPPLATKGPAIGPVIALLAAVVVVGSVIVIPKLMK